MYCGALDAVLEESYEPFAQMLAADLDFGAVNRLAALRDARPSVDPALRNLFAAVTNARVQARRAMLDIQDYAPRSPDALPDPARR